MKRKKNVIQKVVDEVLEVLSPADAKRRVSDWKPSDFVGQKLKCCICGAEVELKLTKKRRPYYNCSGCWTQVFVRGDQAMHCLAKELLEKPE